MSIKRQVLGCGIPPAAADAIGGTYAAVTCVGTAQAGAALLSAETNLLTTASGQTACVLPTTAQGSQVGDSCTVYTLSSTTGLVFPGGAETCNASTSSVSLAQSKMLLLKRVSSTNWGYIVTP